MHSSSRMRNQKFLGLLECRNCLLPGDTWEVFQKLAERVATLDVVNQSLERYSGAHEDWGASENLRIGVDHLPVVRHQSS